MSEIPPTAGIDRSATPHFDMFVPTETAGEGLLEYEVLGGEVVQRAPGWAAGGNDVTGEKT